MDRDAEPLRSSCADRSLEASLVLVELNEAHLLDASAPARCRVKHGRSNWQRGAAALADYVRRNTQALRCVEAPQQRVRFELSREHQRDVLRSMLANLHGHSPATPVVDAWLEHFTLSSAVEWLTIPCCPDALIATQLERIGLHARQCAVLVRTECGMAPLGWVAAADPRALDRALELFHAAARAPVRVVDLVTRTSETFPSFFRAAKAAMKRARAGSGAFDIVVSDFTYVRAVQPGCWFGRWPSDGNDAIQKR